MGDQLMVKGEVGGMEVLGYVVNGRDMGVWKVVGSCAFPHTPPTFLTKKSIYFPARNVDTCEGVRGVGKKK